MKEVDLIENPEMGTSGLSSAMQIYESSNTFTIHFGTVSSPILISPHEDRPEIDRSETFRETLRRVIKKHKESLDALGDP